MDKELDVVADRIAYYWSRKFRYLKDDIFQITKQVRLSPIPDGHPNPEALVAKRCHGRICTFLAEEYRQVTINPMYERTQPHVHVPIDMETFFGGLSEIDKTICQHLIMGVSMAQLGVLLNLPRTTMWRHMNRIREQLMEHMQCQNM